MSAAIVPRRSLAAFAFPLPLSRVRLAALAPAAVGRPHRRLAAVVPRLATPTLAPRLAGPPRARARGGMALE